MSSKKNIIADTNVWYDLANGNTNILDTIKSNGVLCVTPINMLEISSKINNQNFDTRRNAAKAIIQYADRYLMSNESYLVRFWGFNYNDPVMWKEAALTLSRANSIEDLQNGYYDTISNCNRKHKTDLLLDWKDYHYNDFKNSIIKVIESIHPNYTNRNKNNNLRKLTDTKLIKQFDTKEFMEDSILMTYERAKLILKDEKISHSKKATNKMVSSATPKLKVYVKAYSKYLKFLATAPAIPDKNDLGDYELFCYLQNKNWLLATSDKRWINIGKEVCPNNLLDLLQCK